MISEILETVTIETIIVIFRLVKGEQMNFNYMFPKSLKNCIHGYNTSSSSCVCHKQSYLMLPVVGAGNC